MKINGQLPVRCEALISMKMLERRHQRNEKEKLENLIKIIQTRSGKPHKLNQNYTNKLSTKKHTINYEQFFTKRKKK